MNTKEKNTFISHYNEDDEHISNLKELLSRRGYQIKNSSIDSTKTNQASNADYIKRLLLDRIDWAGTFILLIGSKTSTRPWVNWEIEQAHKLGKRIIGIWIHGEKEKSEPPTNFEKYGCELVAWNSDKIVDAIEGKITGWCNQDGTERQKVDLRRFSC